MCTSISYESLDGSKFLSRTMDFAFELNGQPTFLPRDYDWVSSFDDKTYQTNYAIMGTGAKYGKNYMVADGFNEYGLSAAELYFPHQYVYDEKTTEGAINLVSEEFILWALGNNKTIDELRDNLSKVHVIESDKGVMGANQPLHWIFSDLSGATYIIEPEGDGLVLEEDKIGVMTNTPDFDWHRTNLANYLGASVNNFDSAQFGDEEITRLGQNGTFRLPGGYTAVDRFVRTAFNRTHIEKAKDADEAVTTILHILDSVVVPKGVNIGDRGPSYTQYQAILDMTNKKMYYVPYSNQTVFEVTMTDDLIENQTTPKEFDLPMKQSFASLDEQVEETK